MTKDSVCYKIRDANTGLFSSGGTVPRWTKNGKAWSGRGPLLNHLQLFFSYGHWRFNKREQLDIPDNWEIVTYRITEETSNVENAREVLRKHVSSK